MSAALEFGLAPEHLDEGQPEERACFGRLTIETSSGSLTAGIDHFIDGYRAGPLVSGYHAAEWLAWNWWRLRHEPRSRAPDWWRAHTMTAIGEGYVWPNVTIFSDGVRTSLLSDASVRPDAKPFRYLGMRPTVLPSASFERAIDDFISRIEGRLVERGFSDTNLSRIWAELRAERADPVRSERRRLEALLACDPDEADEGALEALLADVARLGTGGVEELAADRAQGGILVGGVELERIAETNGAPGRFGDVVVLRDRSDVPVNAEGPAFLLGARAATALRRQEALGDRPVGDATLAAMAGVEQSVLSKPSKTGLAYTLDREDGLSFTVLRSRHPDGRRFELARLIADRLFGRPGRLHPATRAYTYRQKMQRSFAAELLCPFEPLETFLDGDLSSERQQDAAAHFSVSEMTVRTLLVNHGQLEREELDPDLAA